MPTPQTSSVEPWESVDARVPVGACNGMVLAVDETGHKRRVAHGHATPSAGENEGGSTTGCTPPPSLTEPPLHTQEAIG